MEGEPRVRLFGVCSTLLVKAKTEHDGSHIDSFPGANNESSEIFGHLLPVTYFNLILRPGLIIPQTFDYSLFAGSWVSCDIFIIVND